MTTSSADGGTTGSFIQTEIPQEGDTALVEHNGVIYETKSLGNFTLSPKE